MAFLKHVRANRIRGEWRLTKITRHMAKLCQELGVELEQPAKLRVSLKRMFQLKRTNVLLIQHFFNLVFNLVSNLVLHVFTLISHIIFALHLLQLTSDMLCFVSFCLQFFKFFHIRNIRNLDSKNFSPSIDYYTIP